MSAWRCLKTGRVAGAKHKVSLRTYNPSRGDRRAVRLHRPHGARAGAGGAVGGVGGARHHQHLRRHRGQRQRELDLDAYIAKQLYFIGTSGSTLDDMKLVLAKVLARQLDTNLSVAAVSGLDGAIDGIRAVENAPCPARSSSIRPARAWA